MHKKTGKTAAKTGLFATLCAFSLLLAASAAACTVPVFRYALERWHPDPYLAYVFHEGPLDDAGKKTLANLERAAIGERAANVSVEAFDVKGELPPHIQKLWERERAARSADDPPKLPWCTVEFPLAARVAKPLWTGPLTDAGLAACLDSPLRRQIAERLVAGDSAVWVLLESGDKDADEAAHKLIAAELARLEKELKLPALAEEDKVFVKSAIPLAIKFSLVRLKRDDRAEKVLVEMLLNTEADLAEFSKPMVFPIFGRGRAFYGLIGKGITTENLEQTAGFLIGECSCQVKEENPGMDLLLSASWDKIEGNFSEEPLPPLVGLPATANTKKGEAPSSTNTAPTDPQKDPSEKRPLALNNPPPNVPMHGDTPAPQPIAPTPSEAHAFPVWIVALASVAGVGIVVLLVGSFWVSNSSRPR